MRVVVHNWGRGARDELTGVVRPENLRERREELRRRLVELQFAGREGEARATRRELDDVNREIQAAEAGSWRGILRRR